MYALFIEKSAIERYPYLIENGKWIIWASPYRVAMLRHSLLARSRCSEYCNETAFLWSAWLHSADAIRG